MTSQATGPSRQEALSLLTQAGAPYELAEQTIHGVPCRTFVHAPDSLGALFETARSDATFMVYEQERYSFEEMYRLASRLADAFVNDYDIRKGDRVAISMRNYPEWVVAFTAATSIGAIAVAMNALWGADEIQQGLADCGAKVMLADPERLSRIAAGAAPLSIPLISVRAEDQSPLDLEVRSFRELIDARADDTSMPVVSVLPDDPATIFYTSGSTGFPKGALATHRNILSALFSWELDQQSALLSAGLTPPELEFQAATLLAVPLFHVTGAHAVFLMSYRSQRKLVSMYKWDAHAAAELIEAEQITSFVAPAAMTGDLVQAARSSDRDLSSLASVGGGGAPRAPEQVQDIDDTFGSAMPATGWGMSETNAIGTGIGGADYLERPASSGRASAVVDLKVVDEQGRELPANERGELLIRGVSVIQGYWNRPEANAEAFTEGWLHTGDVAYLDDEGYLFIVDRIKDLIIRGGENIGCGEVEAALLEHPQVLEACAYAIPDPRLGEEVGASIFLGAPDDTKRLNRDDQESHGQAHQPGTDADKIREFLATRLAKFKIPRYLAIEDQPLPRIASGKIFKKQIREAAIAKLDHLA